jgi:uncharacterized protein YbaA (DUF1428 family)
MAGSGNAHLRGSDMVLRAENVNVEFNIGDKKIVRAVSGVSIDIAKGETLAVQFRKSVTATSKTDFGFSVFEWNRYHSIKGRKTACSKTTNANDFSGPNFIT